MARSRNASTSSDVVLYLLAIILPPLPVIIERGCGGDFLACLLLTILGWIPGVFYAWYVISTLPDQSRIVYEERRRSSRDRRHHHHHHHQHRRERSRHSYREDPYRRRAETRQYSPDGRRAEYVTVEQEREIYTVPEDRRVRY